MYMDSDLECAFPTQKNSIMYRTAMEKGQNKGSNKLPSYIVDEQEEMATWIQYPLEDAFDRAYCSGNLGQISSPSRNQKPVCEAAGKNNDDFTRRSCALSKKGEHAMAMGFQRASGFTVQSGLEMFCTLKTMKKDSQNLDSSDKELMLCRSKGLDSNVAKRHHEIKCTIQDSLQCITSEEPSSNLLNPSEHGLQINAGSNKFGGIGYRADDLTADKTNVNYINSNTSGLKSTQPAHYSITEKGLKSREADVEAEMEKACCSAESETSAEMSAKEKGDSYEDLDGDFAESNQTYRRQRKRRRAAETHKLSEKRRRNRINEKLKALQELIPNSSKTDKASILDEAIEYLRALQSQLQMMSTRSSMNLGYPAMQPTMMTPMYPFGFCMPMPYNSLNMNMGMGIMDGLNGNSQRQNDASRDYYYNTANLVSLSTVSQNFSHPSADTESPNGPPQDFRHTNKSDPL